MRLWHEKLIPYLPRQQLLGQHREICALRGKGWGRKHKVVDYVFTHSYYDLFRYHLKIMDEMRRRGFHCDGVWFNPTYRGKILGYENTDFTQPRKYQFKQGNIYAEHDKTYLDECLNNLNGKGIHIEVNR